MPSSPHWDPVAPVAQALVRPVPVDPAGIIGPTKAQAAGSQWRRTSVAHYVPVEVDGSLPEQRVLEQSVRLSPGGTVTGWAALRLLRAAYFDGMLGITRRPVLLIPGPGHRIRNNSDARCSREPLSAGEVVYRHGIRCAVARRALFDEMRCVRNLREAVIAFDMAAAAGLVSLEQMRTYLAERSSWRRAEQVGVVLRHADERSRSPGESRMRLVWELDAGLPRPLVNQEIFTLEGRLVGVADLFDPVAGLVGEYDGSDHLRVLRRSRDMCREEAFRRLGLEYVGAVGPDMRDAIRLAGRMRSTRSRALFAAADDRRWTIEPPPGWPREQSLDERLFLLEMAQQMYRDHGA